MARITRRILASLRRVLFRASHSLPIPRSLKRRLRVKGTISIRIDDRHSFMMKSHGDHIENDLFWRGYGRGWERMSLQVWGRLVSHSRIIMDVGAHSGVYALAAKAINPEATVAAFEPLDSSYRRLTANVKLNGFDIKAVAMAVSDRTGDGVLYHEPHGRQELASLERSAESEVVETTVPTTRLDDYARANELVSIDLLKIDIEGHEVAAIRSLGKYLEEAKPAFLVEVLTEESGAAVWDILRPLGYEAYRVSDTEGLKRESGIGAKHGKERNYLVCQPDTVAAAGLTALIFQSASEVTPD